MMNTRSTSRTLTAIAFAVTIAPLTACTGGDGSDAAPEGATEPEVSSKLHARNHELVCRLDDFLGTTIYVDRDRVFDAEVGKASKKVLEVPTKNASVSNGKLFRVELLSVSRARCPGCDDTQVILYRQIDEAGEVIAEINKLETTSTRAKVTRNVDADGRPRGPVIVVDEGPCAPNDGR